MARHEGGCLCGEIRFVASADPIRISVCHCRFCQRNTGSAYFVGVSFAKEAFEIVKGTPKTYELPSAGSGKTIAIRFCGTCGGRVAMTFERFPAGLGAFAGTFDHPERLGLASGIVRHLFTESAQHGTVLPAGVPLFEQHAITNDDEPNQPTVLAAPVRAGPG